MRTHVKSPKSLKITGSLRNVSVMPRESRHPDLAASAAALDSRLRDTQKQVTQFPVRHCQRSRAIQGPQFDRLGCWRRACCGPWIASSQGLLAMTDGSVVIGRRLTQGGRSAIGVPPAIGRRKPSTKAVIRPSTTARPTRRRRPCHAFAANTIRLPLDARWPQLWRHAPGGRRYPQTPSRLAPGNGRDGRRRVYVNAQPSWAQAIGRPSRAIGRKSRTGGRVCHTRRADNRPYRA